MYSYTFFYIKILISRSKHREKVKLHRQSVSIKWMTQTLNGDDLLNDKIELGKRLLQ